MVDLVALYEAGLKLFKNTDIKIVWNTTGYYYKEWKLGKSPRSSPPFYSTILSDYQPTFGNFFCGHSLTKETGQTIEFISRKTGLAVATLRPSRMIRLEEIPEVINILNKYPDESLNSEFQRFWKPLYRPRIEQHRTRLFATAAFYHEMKAEAARDSYARLEEGEEGKNRVYRYNDYRDNWRKVTNDLGYITPTDPSESD